MTDLTAYEQALVERVARAMWDAGWNAGTPEEDRVGWDALEGVFPDGDDTESFRDVARRKALAALTALGLIGPSRTAWIAPWEATADVVAWGMDRTMYAALRDAHLKEGGA